MSVAIDPAALEQTVGHSFSDAALLEQALTHISAIPLGKSRSKSYQRLEFLGDRVLGLMVSEMLIEEFSHAEEGELSRRLAELVRKETCAEVAIGWGVDRFVRLGGNETQAGARQNQTILSDVCEAIVGAAFLDGGFDAARLVVRKAFGPRVHAPRRPLRDAKTALQEWAQAHGWPAPVYLVVERSGPDHAPAFRIAATVNGVDEAVGAGRSKRDAEQAAARLMLEREGVWSPRRD